MVEKKKVERKKKEEYWCEREEWERCFRYFKIVGECINKIIIFKWTCK